MKDNKGITLVTLAITITVLLILAGVTTTISKQAIDRARLEELRTNMLLLEAKGQQYVEEVGFKAGIKPTDPAQLEEYENKKEAIKNEIYIEKAKLIKADPEVSENIEINDNFYEITEETLKEWDLESIEISDKDRFLIEFDEENGTLKVYNTRGYKGKYVLNDLET